MRERRKRRPVAVSPGGLVRLLLLVLLPAAAWGYFLWISPAVHGAPGDGGAASAEEIAISRRTAGRLGLRVGDVVEIGAGPGMARARTVRVAAIWSTPEHPADIARGDLQIRAHLPVLEELLGRRDGVDRIVVRLSAGGTRPAGMAERVRDDLAAVGAGYDVYTAAELTDRTSQTFAVVSRFHRAIGVVAIMASSVFLAAVMALRLTAMRREMGALRLIGVGPATLGRALLLVAAAVVTGGSLVGVALGAAMVWAINAYYQPLFETMVRLAVLTPRALLLASGVAGGVGLLASAVVVVSMLRRPALEQVGR